MKLIGLSMVAFVALFIVVPHNAGAQMAIEIVKQNEALAKEINLCDATADFIYDYRYNKDTASGSSYRMSQCDSSAVNVQLFSVESELSAYCY